MNLLELAKPFPASDIEWRVQRSGIKNSTPWAMVLAYVTNRAIMQRLDDTCGPENWWNEYRTGPAGGVLCGITIALGHDDFRPVTKWDGAENTDVEPIKGGLSDAMKRAGVQWGIGRYLYKLPPEFVRHDPDGAHRDRVKDGDKWIPFRWNPPTLPAWALPIEKISADQVRQINQMIVATETDAAIFCHHFSVSSPADLVTTQYATALRMLAAKKSKMEVAK